MKHGEKTDRVGKTDRVAARECSVRLKEELQGRTNLNQEARGVMKPMPPDSR